MANVFGGIVSEKVAVSSECHYRQPHNHPRENRTQPQRRIIIGKSRKFAYANITANHATRRIGSKRRPFPAR